MKPLIHGPKCSCLSCRELLALGNRIAARNPKVKMKELDESVQDFVFYALFGREIARPMGQSPVVVGELDWLRAHREGGQCS